LHATAHIGVAGGDPDPDAARDRYHRRLRSSRTRSSASASTSRSTRTQQPPSSISMIPALVRRGGEDSGGAHGDAEAGVDVISTGTSAGTSSFSRPSRARRRHVNNWLADNPLRRAVTDTNRGHSPSYHARRPSPERYKRDCQLSSYQATKACNLNGHRVRKIDSGSRPWTIFQRRTRLRHTRLTIEIRCSHCGIDIA
jgi:hypothetical protein